MAEYQRFNYDQFRTNLKNLIEQRGLLSKDIAEDLNVTRATMSRYLHGVRDPELPYVIKLANYFHVSVDWLLGLTDDNLITDPEIKDLTERYLLASQDDRKIIKMVLSKYKTADAE